jgi:hypothetical protein
MELQSQAMLDPQVSDPMFEGIKREVQDRPEMMDSPGLRVIFAHLISININLYK